MSNYPTMSERLNHVHTASAGRSAEEKSAAGKSVTGTSAAGDAKRFFSPQSYWNTPLPESVPVDAQSSRWVQMLREAALHTTGGLHLNLHSWTIPVYFASADTVPVRLNPYLLHCRLSQGHVKASESRLRAGDPRLCQPGLHESVGAGVPIPEQAFPDSQMDAHMTVIDEGKGRVYDLWNCHRKEDGSWWTNAAIAYDLHGSGVFEAADIEGIGADESVHFYGPCRASGVPALAGLIMRREVEQGWIGHKLALACPVAGLQRYVSPPAVWTDGWLPGGVPEGCCLQLDPALDITALGLSAPARVVARALQEYGAVLVDNAGSVTLYGEFLPPQDGTDGAGGEGGADGAGGEGGSWAGLLGENDLRAIPIERFRVVDTAGSQHEGGSHPVFHHEMAPLFYQYLREHGADALDALEPWRCNRGG